MFSSLEHQIESPVTFSSCNEVRVFIFRMRDFYRSFVSVVIAILNSPSDLARGVHNYCHLASRPSTCYLPPVVPSHAYSPYVMSPRDATPLVLFFFFSGLRGSRVETGQLSYDSPLPIPLDALPSKKKSVRPMTPIVASFCPYPERVTEYG
jgi:hypothetical protein